uniref:Vitellogenin domain-containing protein n=1 Tax=Anopheles dirus TaxID=7168 RepID=A0A182NRT8_9DIPT
MKLFPTSMALTAILLILFPTAALSSCNFGIGSRVQGQYELHKITVRKQAVLGPENLELHLDYKASPLLNQQITFAEVQTESTSSCSFSAPTDNNSKRMQATVRSSTPISELVITMTVYGFNYA